MPARIMYVVAAIALAACYDVPQPECGFVCGPPAVVGGEGTCPSGYVCATSLDNRCHRVSPPFTDPCPGDASVPIDLTPPLIGFRSPSPGAIGVPVTSQSVVEVGFTEPVSRISDFPNFVVEDATGIISGGVIELGPQSDGFHHYQYQTARPFFPSTVHTVTLTDQITDFAGNNLVGTSWTFTTEADETPPMVLAIVPANLSANVNVNTMINVTFTEEVTGVSTATFTLTGPSGQVSANLTTLTPVTSAALTPFSALLPDTEYTITLSSAITDLAGNPLVFTPTTFRTAPPDNTPPMVAVSSPSSGSTGVSVISSITTTFTEQVTNVNLATYTLTGPSGALTGIIATGTTSATFNPTNQLLPFTTYTFDLSAAIVDLASNALVPFSGTFTTGADTVAPNLLLRFPATGATNVPVNTTVRADFDEPLTNLNATTFQIAAGTTVPATVVLAPSPTNRATLTPSTQLAANTTYTVMLASTLQDASGNMFGAAPVAWMFTTGPDLIVPNVITTSPADNATGVAVDATISVTFDEPVVNVDATSFVVMNAGTGTYASSNSGRTWTFTPDADLSANAVITIMLTNAIEDAAGNALVPVAFDFTTAP